MWIHDFTELRNYGSEDFGVPVVREIVVFFEREIKSANIWLYLGT